MATGGGRVAPASAPICRRLIVAGSRSRAATAVDLHVHSAVSDGSDAPAALVAAAARAGVEVLALTDHDTVAGVGEAREAGVVLGVEVLTGCEVTAEVAGRVVHLLAYGDGLLGQAALDEVTAARRRRADRNRAIGRRLCALTGIGYEEAAALAAGSALSRAHFATALVAGGAVADVAEAFDRYLSSGRPAYVPAPSLPARTAVDLVHRLGGVVVLAHPGRLADAERDRVVAAALGAGVDGVEVWHSQHDPAVQRRWGAFVDRAGLLATGGSDYHGRHKPGVALGGGRNGNVAVPRDAVVRLAAMLARRRASAQGAESGRFPPSS
jgi:3',5'-nucleoside bisphosphate phosphatase